MPACPPYLAALRLQCCEYDFLDAAWSLGPGDITDTVSSSKPWIRQPNSEGVLCCLVLSRSPSLGVLFTGGPCGSHISPVHSRLGSFDVPARRRHSIEVQALGAFFLTLSDIRTTPFLGHAGPPEVGQRNVESPAQRQHQTVEMVLTAMPAFSNHGSLAG